MKSWVAKKWTRKRQRFYTDSETQHGRWVAKKRRFYADSETQHGRRVAKKMDKIKTTFLL